MSEIIHKADHYNMGKYEVIEVIWDWGLFFCLGNVLKYIGRAEHKGKALEDLKKAREYVCMELTFRSKFRVSWFKKFIFKMLFKPTYKINPADVVEDWKLKGNLRAAVCYLGMIGMSKDQEFVLKCIKECLDNEIMKREVKER